MGIKYPSAIRKSNGDIKVLYEKCHSIEKLVEDVSEKLDTQSEWTRKFQSSTERRIGILDERTAMTNKIVYSSLILAIGSIIATASDFLGLR